MFLLSDTSHRSLLLGINVIKCLYPSIEKNKSGASAAVRAASQRVKIAKEKASREEMEKDNIVDEVEVEVEDNIEVDVVDQDTMTPDVNGKDGHSPCRLTRSRSRLLRQLAVAERKREKEEAQRVRKLLQRATEQEKIYKKQFIQSTKTRNRLDSSTTTNTSQATLHLNSIKDQKRKTSTTGPLLNSSVLNLSNRTSSSEGKNRNVLKVVSNIPLLDICTGRWKGIWDLFKGSLVVAEFYLSNSVARSVPPVIAVDP
mmetsp:Transcript_20712/g.26940  ORF Transcript_20712/g.26940 Transcript_20712/m.26940 type:complete len:257 (-) Transcript_20712:767-1537(-)